MSREVYLFYIYSTNTRTPPRALADPGRFKVASGRRVKPMELTNLSISKYMYLHQFIPLAPRGHESVFIAKLLERPPLPRVISETLRIEFRIQAPPLR